MHFTVKINLNDAAKRTSCHNIESKWRPINSMTTVSRRTILSNLSIMYRCGNCWIGADSNERRVDFNVHYQQKMQFLRIFKANQTAFNSKVDHLRHFAVLVAACLHGEAYMWTSAAVFSGLLHFFYLYRSLTRNLSRASNSLGSTE